MTLPMLTIPNDDPRDWLYFAYGSNLNKSQMKTRLGKVEEVQTAVLHDFKLTFPSTCTLVPAPGKQTPGAIYGITAEQRRKLDRREGVPNSYRQTTVKVVGADGKTYECLTYVISNRNGPRPQGYVEIVRQGYIDWGLGPLGEILPA
ncbi:MAG: gamma-glutamylcyclotransferase [Deltaproteobacteria bacterium]|nr:gamma-glutamylcyclotransferase [Deltaproteobacteria bacterium]